MVAVMINGSGFEWQESVSQLINVLQRSDFAVSFLDSIKAISDFDSAVIMAYGVGPTPKYCTISWTMNTKMPFTTDT
tara:strand:- start:130 stop:360 length:231 start_codon:yes stop_codon:yes gene_type:complete